jgi:hypothetical protein
MGCIVIAMLFNKKYFLLNLMIRSTEKERTIHWGFALTTIILALMYRLLLTKGFYSLFA